MQTIRHSLATMTKHLPKDDLVGKELELLEIDMMRMTFPMQHGRTDWCFRKTASGLNLNECTNPNQFSD